MRKHLIIFFLILIAAVLVELFLLKGGKPGDVRGIVQRLRALGSRVHVIFGVAAVIILVLTAFRLLVMLR